MNWAPVELATFAFAAGTSLAATLVVGLMAAPGSRGRAYLGFSALLTAWMAVLAAGRAAPGRGLALVSGALATLLPAAFLLFSAHGRLPGRARAAAVALALVAVPFAADASPLASTAFGAAWQVAAWGVALAFLLRGPRPASAAAGTLRRVLVALTAAIVLLALLLDGPHLASGAGVAAVQALVLYGAVRLRLYDADTAIARGAALARDAAHGERLALVGELAAGVAHEVRNPLAGMRSLAQQLASGPLAPGTAERYGEVLVREADRIERIVAQLLALARARPAADVTVPLGALLDDVALLVRGAAAERRVRIEVASGPADAAVPRDVLAPMLLNLVLNAVRHARGGGAVQVTAARGAEGLRVAVRDDGPGLTEEALARLFRPFETSHGTGLGLAITRRLADERGWRLAAANAPGGGAEFSIVIPAVPGEGR